MPIAAMQAFLLILACGVAVGTGAFAWFSWREEEPRAMRMALLLGAGAALFLTGAVFLTRPFQAVLLMILGGLLAGFVVAFFLPIGRSARTHEDPRTRVDERDIPFAWARLKPGTPQHQAYYQMRPAKQSAHDAIRALPGLLSPRAALAHPLLFAAAEGSFALTGALREAVDGPPAAQKMDMPPGEATAYIKHLARYFGAQDVGIAVLMPAHFYTHVGRGTGSYGSEILAEVGFGIAFTVEMAHDMIAASPSAAAVMESAHQYVESARVAVQLAAAIRGMGYAARAHIDGNYRVIAPLVARDAGLGEIGRMGLLMTPRLGPRVRLGVVSTNLPLIADGRKAYPSVIDFCEICQKCAVCCPSKAIPFDGRREIEGVLRWKIDAERCFGYWNRVGTDCGRCMAVCPYAHPDQALHSIVRWGIRRSGFFRRVANQMENVFYGKHPAPHRPPAWLPPKHS